MNNQKGFVGIVVLLVIAVLGVGGYYVYKNKEETKVPVEQNVEITDTNNTPPIVIPSEVKTYPSVTTAAKVSCDNNWDCLITAAKSCQTGSGLMVTSGIPVPMFEGVLVSGKIKMDLKSSGSSCVLTNTTLQQSYAITARGRADLITKGMTDTEIDSQLKMMNESTSYTIGKSIVCTGSASLIATHLSDEKNGGTGTFTSTGGTSGSQIVYTTSSGQKLTCVAV